MFDRISIVLGGCLASVALFCASPAAQASGGGGACPLERAPAAPHPAPNGGTVLSEYLGSLECAYGSSEDWRAFYFEYWAYTPQRGAGARTPTGELERTGTGAIEGEEVSAVASGLLPNTEYSYQLVLLNEAGETAATSPGNVFTTPPTVAAIDGESAGSITPSGATLEAEINPNNVSATYLFRYYAAGRSPAEATSLPEERIASGYGDRAVDVSLAGLAPATTYDYWVTAFNPVGLVEGAVQSFTTQPAPEQPANTGGGAGPGGPTTGAGAGPGDPTTGGGQTASTGGEGGPAAGTAGIVSGDSGNALLSLQDKLTVTPVIRHDAGLRTLTRGQRLAAALKACRRELRRQRQQCDKRARIRYGLKAAGAKKTGRQGSRH
jgi:hypothetical protein